MNTVRADHVLIRRPGRRSAHLPSREVTAGFDVAITRRPLEPIGIALSACSDVAEAHELRTVLLDLAGPGPADVVVIDPQSMREVHQPAPSFRAVIVPPLREWIGLDHAGEEVRALSEVLEKAELVIAVGTGAFMVAATGLLDDHDVIADRSYAAQLSACAPAARVHVGISAVADRRVVTVATRAHNLVDWSTLLDDVPLRPTADGRHHTRPPQPKAQEP